MPRGLQVLALAPAMALTFLCGCTEIRVHVLDASTGAAITGAHVNLEDADGVVLDHARSGGAGDAAIGTSARATLLYVAAHGYRAAGLPWPPQRPTQTIEVALQPGWVDDFVENPAHPVPPPEIIPSHICPCRQ